MNPDQALKLVDNICSQVSLNRECHLQVQQAIQVLQGVIDLKKKEETEKTEEPEKK